ncbi:hypothetical protein KIN20_010062 [Parelaphostrongylus tenuis]|uniref:Uncharacterized protein n=1 Tax=Parelaphostrongylus tenuis TaxID=148309 RepID=A0AAD5M929_PARTN|nr:hypothetical protein KIN20_010062 [Parelaphostrongylus tenuis]
MQTVSDVLESQGRCALLPDALITTILAQLNVTVNYEPMLYQTVIHNILIGMADEMKAQNCIVVGSTVTGISTVMTDQEMKMCTDPQATIGAIPTSHTEKNCADHKYHHGDLDKNDVAKSTRQSDQNAGIRSVWITFLLSDSQRRWKLKLNLMYMRRTVLFNRYILSHFSYNKLASCMGSEYPHCKNDVVYQLISLQP